MNKEQLSEAVGRVDQTLLAEALNYEISPRRRRWSRVALLAACLAALLTVTAAAAALSGRWKLWTEEKNSTIEIVVGDGENESVIDDSVLYGRAELSAHPLPSSVAEEILRQAEAGEFAQAREFSSVEHLEETYGIHLLHVGNDGTAQENAAYAEAQIVPSKNGAENGICLFGGWLAGTDAWMADVNFELCTEEMSSEETPTILGYIVKQVKQITPYDIKSLGVQAQIATVEYDDGSIGYVSFLVYDNVAYSIDFNNLSGAGGSMDWVCSMLETLHS